MSLIVMCCYDTEENGRSEYTKLTLESLADTVDWKKHKIIVIDNNSCKETKTIINKYKDIQGFNSIVYSGIEFKKKHLLYSVITLSENVGTARGINMGLRMRKPGENCIKIDNDVVIHDPNWVEQMEEVIARCPEYGIVGLKRKDLRQTPYDADPNFRSELRQLPHEAGQSWIVVEETEDIMGTCTMLSSTLIDKIGGYAQPKNYAFDDTLLNLRAGLAGFKKCFLPHIEITHLDRGDNPYSQEKIQIANEAWPEYHKLHKAYIDGTRPLYEEI